MEHNHIEDKDLELKNIEKVNGKSFYISTIKIDIKHNWLNQNDNVKVYETMIFSEIEDGKINYHDPIYVKRYTNYEDAKAGHKKAISNINDIVAKICV